MEEFFAVVAVLVTNIVVLLGCRGCLFQMEIEKVAKGELY